MQIISNVALISINETLLFQMISFLIFLFIINRIMFRPLRQTMRDREDYIKRLNEEIEDAREALQDGIEQAQIEEDAIRNAAFKVCETLEKSAGREADEILKSARAEMTEMSNTSRKEVSLKLAEARESIHKEAEALALTVMEKVLQRKVAT